MPQQSPWQELKASQPGKRKDLSPWEELKASQPATLAEGAQQVGSKLGRGLVGTLTGAVEGVGLGLEGAGKIAKKLPRGAPGLVGGLVDAWAALQDAGAGEAVQGYAKAVSAVAAKALPEVERLSDSLWLSTAPEALGSGLGFMLPGAALKALGVPAWASTMSLGAAVQSAAQFEDARMAGASEEDQWKAWMLGGGLGLSEAIPLSRILNRANAASGGALRHALIDGAIEGGEEFLQEAGSQLASNAIAADLLRYDEDRDVWEGVLKAGLGGAFSGVMMSGLATAVAQARTQGSKSSGLPEAENAGDPLQEAQESRTQTTEPSAPRTIADVSAAEERRLDEEARVTEPVGPAEQEQPAAASAAAGITGTSPGHPDAGDETSAAAGPTLPDRPAAGTTVSPDASARKVTRAAQEKADAARKLLREAINNPDLVGAQRADRIANLRNLIGFHQAQRRPLETDVRGGDEVAYTGVTTPDGFREFIYLEGAKAGSYGHAMTNEERASVTARKIQEERELQEGFARLKPAPVAAPAPAETVTEEAPESTAPVVNPPESPEGSPATTSIKNAVVDRELAEMGLPPAEHGERVADRERHAKAMEKLQAEPEAGARLVTDLEASQRPPTGDEGAMLALEVNRLINERDAAQDAFNADPSEANQARIDKAVADYARAADVVTKAGTESSASLRIRKMMIARDYSLAAMERSLQVAKGGEALTAEETAKVAELHRKLAAAEKAHAEYVTAAEAKRAELEAENALLRLKRQVKGDTRRAKRSAEIEQAKKDLAAALDELGASMSAGALGGNINLRALAKAAHAVIRIGGKSFAQFADEMVARFGEEIRPHVKAAWDAAQGENRKDMAASLRGAEKPEVIHRGVEKIALDFVEAGVTNREALVDAVHDVVSAVLPNMTREQTRDAISGYGIFRPLSKLETAAKLRDIKAQLRQVAKLEDLAAKIPPKKTGVEHRAPSQEERRLIKQVNELSRRLGIRGTEKSRLQARKTYLEDRIADLKGRMERGEFGARPKPPPVEMDAQATKLKADYEEARRQFEREKEKHRLANRTRGEKALDAAKEAVNLPKAIMTAWDASAVLRQGLFFTLGHPIRSAQHVAQMFSATFSERRALVIDTQIRNRPLFAFGESSGLDLTRHGDDLGKHEEAIRSALSDKIPGLKASNRAYITFLNSQRAAAFDALVASIPGTPTKEQGKAIANLVNVATGRGNPGKFAGAMSALAVPLWSPRLLLSRFQLLAGQPLYGGDATTRALVAKEYGRFLIGLGAVYGLAKLVGLAIPDDEDKPTIETDPRSSDFGKIRIGNTRIDPLAGLSQVTVLLSRLASGSTKSSASGAVTPIRGEVPYGRDTAADVVANFMRSKLSPTIGIPLDALSGENMVGEAVTPGSVATDLLVPLSFQDIRKAMIDRGVPAGAALGILSIFGAGLQVHTPKPPKPKKKK